MNTESDEPSATSAAVSPWALPDGATRHDGWTGERMATFCETLAETGLVVDACLAAGKSTNTAYSARRRNPMFAAAWEAALTIARDRLADTLLTRSIEGVVEQYYKDGELVGERKLVDNRLGLAILRRLDRMAETGSPLHASFPGAGRGPGQCGSAAPQRLDPGLRRGTVDWDLALSALRSGEPDAIAEALAMLKGPALSLSKGNEAREARDPPIHTPLNELCNPPEDEGLDLSDRFWKDGVDDIWITDFPPPPGFDGYQGGEWGESDYDRVCTPEEVAVLEADAAADRLAGRAEDEELRDAWFAMLKGEAEKEGANVPELAASTSSHLRGED